MRPLAVTVVGLAHAGLLAALVMGNVGRAPAAVEGAAIAVHAVAPAPVVETTPVLTLATIDPGVAAPTIEMAADATGDCGLSDEIARALANDAAVGAALAGSTQTAIMVWDGQWNADAAAIRRVVMTRVRAATLECRNAALIGPRLLIVPTGSTSVAVALGSGTWRWAAVLA